MRYRRDCLIEIGATLALKDEVRWNARVAVTAFWALLVPFCLAQSSTKPRTWRASHCIGSGPAPPSEPKRR